MSATARRRGAPEWPTLALAAACYGLWALAVGWLAALWLPLAIAAAVVAIALHSSLQHEALHGHPFADGRANAALVFPALGLFVPYARFRDTHLAHHRDANLTDPYDDPESNYFDPAVWRRLARPVRAVLRANNTLAGRMLLGPAIGLIVYWHAEARAIATGDRAVRAAWLRHGPAAGLVGLWVWAAAMPVWAYLLAAYGGMAVLKIRTFLEHQAHERTSHRSVIIEDRGPLALLFLNNNLHVVHHMHPAVAWYRLPKLYRAGRARYLARNGGYRYASYWAVMRAYLWRAKDPVAHPLRWGQVRQPEHDGCGDADGGEEQLAASVATGRDAAPDLESGEEGITGRTSRESGTGSAAIHPSLLSWADTAPAPETRR